MDTKLKLTITFLFCVLHCTGFWGFFYSYVLICFIHQSIYVILGAESHRIGSRMSDAFVFGSQVCYVLVLRKGGDRCSSYFEQMETSMCKHILLFTFQHEIVIAYMSTNFRFQSLVYDLFYNTADRNYNAYNFIVILTLKWFGNAPFLRAKSNTIYRS